MKGEKALKCQLSRFLTIKCIAVPNDMYLEIDLFSIN